MTGRRVAAVWAQTENGVIGHEQGLPWDRIKADMQHFRRLTLGQAVVMGRKTFESLGSRPLKDRANIILTRDPGFRAEGTITVNSVQDALRAANFADDLFVIGGAEVYAAFLPHYTELHRTVIGVRLQGDTRIPDMDLGRYGRRLVREVAPTPDCRYHLQFDTFMERLP